MTADETARRRVLIVAGGFADAAPAISMAAALAALSRAALLGVLAREPLAELAEGAPVLSAAGGGARALTREALESAWAADARAFQRRLSETALAAQLGWEFRSDPGTGAELALRLRRPGDMVMLGYRRLYRRQGPVVVLGGPSVGGGDAGAGAGAGEKLAQGLAGALHLRAMTLAWPARSDDVGEREAQLLEELSASLLVLNPRAGLAPQRLAALLEAARCPVLIGPDDGDADVEDEAGA
ncbi:MAG: hypothetical protein JJT95_04155 [Pararhodobacter sp.]|nr:hypothetical protein [Pararhodobacter sp.]